MQKLVIGLVAVLAISACSHDKKNNPGAGPETPARTTEHKAAECPTDLVGTWTQIDDPENKFEIVINQGILVIKDPESGDIKVDGTPQIDNDNGSSTSLICKNNTIDMQVTFKDGSKGSAVMKRTDVGLRSNFSNGEEVNFVRTGAATSPTETELKLDTEAEGPKAELGETPTLDLGLEPGETVVEVVTCNTGYMKEYTYEDTGCSTGKHTFCSKQEYCDGLKNEALNNSCMPELRAQKFKANCL